MQTYSITLLTLASYWRPRSWVENYQKIAYRIYNIICMLIYYTFMISEILDIVLVAENMAQVTENMIQLTNVINVVFKSLSFLANRSRIIKVLDYLESEMCKPQTPSERQIQDQHEGVSWFTSKVLFTFYIPSVVTFVYLPFFITNTADRVLPYRAWRPYSLDNVNLYYMTYLHHSLAVTIAATVNSASETLASSLLIQVCAQFDILAERLKAFPRDVDEMHRAGKSPREIAEFERDGIVSATNHHRRIFEMVDLINGTFVWVIFSQLTASVFVLCVCTYSLAMMEATSSAFWIILLFQLCMFIQIFLYTWYGNEVTLKSSEFGYKLLQIDWLSLSEKSRKNLLFIALRTRRPVYLSSGYVITLSNIAFMKILKTSYSVYNVLSV